MSFSQEQIDELFFTALELSPDDREDFLKRSCADNPSLLKKIRILLAADDSAENEDFLRASAIEQNAELFAEDYPADVWIGKTIGRYCMVRRIGTGGMGAVYLAERSDGQFTKRVALKLIKRGMDSEAILNRFLRERQILANLEHPNIARLLDAGMTEDGLPFLVMEYVEGVPVNEFCSAHKLGIEERLKLFLDVCEAVTHAHQNLVVHRDIKPSNILVTDDGTPKLLDFGIAKLLNSDETGGTLTNAEFRVLTPDYASPEQMRGETITTASDVYSLGVVLYELLTENQPFRLGNKSLDEAIRAVSEAEPRKPSDAAASNTRTDARTTDRQPPNEPATTVNPKALRGDLDNIILEALQKDAARRYSSVEKLTDDIHRYLAGLPVTARRPTWQYRARKYVRRNRLAVVVAALFLLVLGGGVAATVWQARRATRERQRAEQRFNDVRRLANSLISEFPDEVDKSATKAKEMLVRRSLEYLDSLAHEAGEDTGLQRELATAYEKIGNLQGNEYYANLGDTQGALDSYRKSLRLRAAVLQIDAGNPEVQAETAQSFERVGDILWSMEDLRQALENYREALRIRDELFAASRSDMANMSLALVLYKTGDLLGNDSFSNLGDVKGALEHHRRALEIRESLVAKEPENPQFLEHLLSSYTNMANVLRLSGDVQNAEQNYRRGLALAQKIAALKPSDASFLTTVALSYLYLGDILTQNGKYDEAITNLLESLKIIEKNIAADAQDMQSLRQVAVINRRLGTTYLKKGETDKSLEVFRKALAISEKQAAADPSNKNLQGSLSLSYAKFGDALAQTNDERAATENYRKALEIRKTLLAENPENTKSKTELANIYFSIGDYKLKLGKVSEALENLQKALNLREEIAAIDPANILMQRELVVTHDEIAETYLKTASDGKDSELKNCADARDELRRGQDIWNRVRDTGVFSKADENLFEALARRVSACQKGSPKT